MSQLARHRRALYAMLLGIVLATTGWVASSWAQETDAPNEESGDVETQAEAESVSEEIDVDDGSYIDAEEEDFRPSEEISADESITFPTDI
jgi:hypothetical protein